MNRLKIFHPFLFALFPVFFLYANNKDLVHPSYAFWPLIIILLLSIAVFLLIEHFLRNIQKAAILSSAFFITFFSFGHYLKLPYLIFEEMPFKNLDYYCLFAFWIVLLAVITCLVVKSKRSFKKITAYLNTVSIILLIMPISTIAWYEISAKNIDELIKNENSLTDVKNTNNKPDIYYIVLDGYGRNDVLQKYYGFDIGSFIKDLEDRGFFVAEKGTTNYPQTYLSIASSLNYAYLDELSQVMGADSGNRGPLREMIKESRVYKTLKTAGYKFVAFPYTWTGTYDNLHADIFMQNKINTTEFTDLLVQSTPLRIFSNKNLFLEGYRNKFYFAFDHLPDIAKIETPTFVYVHLLIPHPPFVFDEGGAIEKMESDLAGNDGNHYFEKCPGVDKYKKAYVDQTKFASKNSLKTIDSILSKSSTPPIIILQADHGPGSMLDWEDPDKTNMHERMSILNAYYLPDKGKKMLYDSITPVNTFRVVFNTLFDADLELLEDKNYFSRWNHPYDFIDVTKKVNSQ
ncbi:MAG: hypothetical protein U9M90_03955 [Patescibacteria group bacterium]|nr:hypothetical protein [Patescibacteria group bacterium]